ncbi:venom allergen 5.01-like [Pararge aegeria]|uniref:venom allergen 5.01-like n=1 Tax=Pararge aegeria TaxID=116150 RepID=UPI0019D24368|nr:venom allergen 5.01-like [Pararge aegeria]
MSYYGTFVEMCFAGFVFLILINFMFSYYVICSVSNSSDIFFDYCSHPDCSLKNQHTMCVAKNKHSPRLFASGMTTWMRYQILQLHNRHRDNIAMGLEAGQPPAANMRKMYWDYELEEIAEIWARQCQKRHDECRNTIRFNVIQNMDVRPVVPRVTEAQILADTVGAWFSGSRTLPPEYVRSFKPTNCSAPGGCNAHWYSAAAWASTWRIGCSQALCTVRQSSCILFRKRRTLSALADNSSDTVTRTTTLKDNLLRRTKYMTTARSSRLEDFGTTVKKGDSESALYRGVLDLVDKQKKINDPNIMAYIFCNYGPAGNIDGFPIYEPGITCSNCPYGTVCGAGTHRALCSLVGDPDNKE